MSTDADSPLDLRFSDADLRAHITAVSCYDAWPDWFAEAGLAGAELPPGPTYRNRELSTTMVEQHQGVSLAYDAVVRGTIDSG